MSETRIDAHHHLWRYNDRDHFWMSAEMNVLRCDFLMPELERVLAQSGISGAVAVPVRQTIAETRWLLELARTADIICGIVGWVPLAQPDLRESLEGFTGNPKLRGFRHVLHDEPDDDYLLGEDFNRGIGLLKGYGLVYDILILERHTPRTLAFVDRHLNLVFRVDHIAKPRIHARVLSPWSEILRELARWENVHCKISGVLTEADWNAWTPADQAPHFEVVLAVFGPKRLMFGSDLLVLNLAADYATWVEIVDHSFAALSEQERSRIWGETAVEAYRLDHQRN